MPAAPTTPTRSAQEIRASRTGLKECVGVATVCLRTQVLAGRCFHSFMHPMNETGYCRETKSRMKQISASCALNRHTGGDCKKEGTHQWISRAAWLSGLQCRPGAGTQSCSAPSPRPADSLQSPHAFPAPAKAWHITGCAVAYAECQCGTVS